MALGAQIKDLNELMVAAYDRKAITIPGTCWKRVPAAFMINQQGHVLCRLLNQGMFIYEKEPENVRRKAGINGGSAENEADGNPNA